MSLRRTAILLTLASCILISQYPTTARILKKCEAVKELRRSKVVSKSFIAHLVCVMQYESHYNSSLVKGPGSRASYSYGVFQISSDKWCSRYRVGGECKKKCDDFANDDIQDDIVCADLIFRKEGLKHWPAWVKNCKNGKLPSLEDCKEKKSSDDYDEVNGNADGNVNEGSDESIDDSEEENGSEGESDSVENDGSFADGDKYGKSVADLLRLLNLEEELTLHRQNVRQLKYSKQITKDIRNPAVLRGMA